MSMQETFEPDPIEIDPRPCGECGLMIDRHQRVDTPEGPEFYCLSPDEMTLDELERRAELIRQVEVAAIFAQLEAMDDPSKRLPQLPAELPSCRTSQATVDAFWFVVGLDDLDRLAAWLDDHQRDKPTLLKLLESK